jgi:uncharacterized membrane protein YesL
MEKENSKKGFSKTINFIYRLTILNIITFITIVLGLGIFSFLPALVSLIVLLQYPEEDTIGRMIKLYFRVFKKIYFKAELVFLVLASLVVLDAVSIFYFYCWLLESSAFFYVIAYYVVLFVEIYFILALVNSCFIIVYYPHLKLFKVIKYSFNTIVAVMLKMVFIFLLLIGTIYISILFVPALPLISISLFMFCAYKLLDEPYKKMVPKGYNILSPYEILED